MSNEFSLGDIVKLRSGGPKMTVDNIDRECESGVVWFCGLELKRAILRNEALRRLERKKARKA